METAILDSLDDLGYPNSLLEEEFYQAVKDGPKSINFTSIVEWLTKELQIICQLEECVNAITGAEDSNSFLLELSSFLKELNCPHQSITEGPVSQRLTTTENRLILLEYLCSELQAARMIAVEKPDTSKIMQVEMKESPTACDLKGMLIALGFAKPPPPNITPAQLFSKVEGRIKDIINKLPSSAMSKPLFTGVLTQKQWYILEELQKQMHEEYLNRRSLLLKRLDVTIESFKWSERLKSKAENISSIFQTIRATLKPKPSVHLAGILAARDDLAIIEKTSCDSVRKKTQCKINKIIIGGVPDRGGRPEEQQPPPPEMPSWQKRPEPQKGGFGSGGGGGFGGGGGGSGGRVQSGWSGDGQRGGGGDRSNRGQGSRSGGGGGYAQPDPYQQSGGYRQGGAYQDGGRYQQASAGGGGGYQQGVVGGYNMGAYQQGGYASGGGGFGGYSQGGGSQGFEYQNTNYPQGSFGGYGQGGGGGYGQGGGGGYNQGVGGYGQSRGGGAYQQGGGGYQQQGGGGRGGRGGGGRGGRGGNRGGKGGGGQGGNPYQNAGGGNQYGTPVYAYDPGMYGQYQRQY